MIGFYDYTVILTYLSILSGTTGIILCLNGIGHPYLGMFFLLFSGLCDTFDGKVARTKKNRTEKMKKFGIQIDSLSDLIAFGKRREDIHGTSGNFRCSYISGSVAGTYSGQSGSDIVVFWRDDCDRIAVYL